ncbi:LOW QUALITY PROTEIN: E3 ubiquitin-protein ligase TRIM21-like [Etheostoma spectabile]|uniref:LOW QUALITY PROTEIN: E3 ubiquitin-protein ligase TRIM21-like n=1 Tax=Etheostoma spectabile TaxID=54343 RepID=UPI0013AF5301|nr:LOW QUALITY PROTEIN: E3 ubiquitin-protein ligase TRIM21-like [Etheostoma spectabile]
MNRVNRFPEFIYRHWKNPDMASASSLLCEEQLLCSICLDAFTEPVSTPCGHNYCKACITGYWASSGQIQCPLCKKKFRKKQQLQVNTEFRDMVEHFNNVRLRGDKDILAKPGEVPCDICLEPKLKAQKTCLVCLASYCQPHLEPHQRVKSLKKHQLIDPVSNLEDRVCERHDKMFELFCRKDQMCVCFMCLKDNHARHEAIPLERAFKERKVELGYVMSEIKMMENTKSMHRNKIDIDIDKKELEKEIADISEVFTALVVSLQRSQADLIRVIQEKQKAAQKEAEDCMTQLEQEVAESRRRRSEIEKLLQTEDHLHLLQSRPSLLFHDHTEDLLSPLSYSTSPLTSDLNDISRQSFVGMVIKAVAHMEKKISNEMEMVIHEVRLSDGCDAAENVMTDEFVKEAWTPPQDKLMMVQQCNAVDVTLDPYTANSKLEVSQDGKQLRFAGGLPSCTALFGRSFVRQPFVLGKEGFSSGRFYYEVRVIASKGWLLGVVKESINREILFFPTPKEGGWTIIHIYNPISQVHEENFANNFSNAPLYLRQRSQTVGVFVDYEKGEVSFYDVENRTLIYSYTGCAFMETPPAQQDVLYSMAATSLSSKPKLYPIFGIFENDYDNMLVITPVV